MQHPCLFHSQGCSFNSSVASDHGSTGCVCNYRELELLITVVHYMHVLLSSHYRHIIDSPLAHPNPNTALTHASQVHSRALLSYNPDKAATLTASTPLSVEKALVPVSTGLTQYMEKTISQWRREGRKDAQPRPAPLSLPATVCACPTTTPEETKDNLTHAKL